MSGPKPKVTDEQILERRQLADQRGESLDVVAADLGISLRNLSKHSRRLGLTMTRRRVSAVHSAGQRERNARERREHPDGAHIDRLPRMGSARRHALSEQGELRRSPEATQKAMATLDLTHPGWRTKRPATMRAALQRKLWAEFRAQWKKVHMKKARAVMWAKPLTEAQRAGLAAAQRKVMARQGRDQDYFQAMWRLRNATTPSAVLALAEEYTGAARELVLDQLSHRRGRQPTAPPAASRRRGPTSRVDLDAFALDVAAGLTTQDLAAKHHITERHARRLAAPVKAELERT
jgi:hypothetical protein